MAKIRIKKLIRLFKRRRVRILTALVLGILVLLGALFFYLGREKKDVLAEILYDRDKPIPVKKGSKYGYFEPSKEMIIYPSYDEAYDFYGDYALVGNKEEDEMKYFLIDKKGKIKKESTSTKIPKYYCEYGVWLIDNHLYSYEMKPLFEEDASVDYMGNGYFAFQKNGEQKSGIIDSKGNEIFSWDEDYITANISESSFKDTRYATVSNFEEAEYIIDLKNGKKVFELEDPKNEYIQKEKDGVFRIISRENKYKTKSWMYLSDGKIKSELTDEDIYDLILESEKKGILKIDYGQDYEEKGKDSRYLYYDVKKNDYLKDYEDEFDPDGLNKERYGYIVYQYENFGLKNKRNRELLKDEYDSIEFLNLPLYKYTKYHTKKEIAILRQKDSVIIYDAKKRKELENFEYVSLRENKESSFISLIQYEEDGHTKKNIKIYNVLSGKTKEIDKDAEVIIGTNYIKVDTKRIVKYYDVNLEEITEE